MGDLLRKVFRFNYEKVSRGQLEDAAEGAALMQEQHARDVVSIAEVSGLPDSHKEKDQRIVRALETVRQLG